MVEVFTVDKLLKDFDEAVVPHKLYAKAKLDLEAFHRSSSRIGFLCGPPLSGKSTLARDLADTVNAASEDGIPLLYGAASGLSGRSFFVDEFVKPFAVAAQVPALDDIVGPPQQQELLFGEIYVVPRLPGISNRERAALMCEALGRAVKYRRVEMLVVDGIERIFPGTGQGCEERVMRLQAIAEAAHVRLLLVGRDELVAKILKASVNQGMMPVIRLPRYADPARQSEYRGLWQFAHKLLERVPMIDVGRITGSQMGKLQEKCLGCPGLLVEMMRAALHERLSPGLFSASYLKVEHIAWQGENSRQLLRRLESIRVGERAIAEFVNSTKEDDKVLRQELGLSEPTSKSESNDGRAKSKKVAQPTGGIHQPGVCERKPGRIMQ